MPEQKRYTIPELADRLAQACAIDERLANIEQEIRRLGQSKEKLPRVADPSSSRALPKILYSPAEAAQALSVCRATVDKMIAQGYLPTRKIGRLVLIHRKDLERLATIDLPSLWEDKTPWLQERKKAAQE